jgi:serine/threonine protein kinase
LRWSGGFGIVFKAINKQTNEIVAIKRIRMGEKKEGVSFVGLREVKFQRELNHSNILHVLPLTSAHFFLFFLLLCCLFSVDFHIIISAIN